MSGLKVLNHRKPHLQDILIMSTNCDNCGYRDNEVKSGSAISDKGKRITLKVEDREDLSRDILKVPNPHFPLLNLRPRYFIERNRRHDNPRDRSRFETRNSRWPIHHPGRYSRPSLRGAFRESFRVWGLLNN
jgi:hypothetical protein